MLVSLAFTLTLASTIAEPSIAIGGDTLAGPLRLHPAQPARLITTSAAGGAITPVLDGERSSLPALRSGSGTAAPCGDALLWVSLSADKQRLVVMDVAEGGGFRIAPLPAAGASRVVSVPGGDGCTVAVALVNGDVLTLDVEAWEHRLGRAVFSPMIDPTEFPRGLLFEAVDGAFVIGAPDGSLVVWRTDDGAAQRFDLPELAVAGAVHTEGGLWFMDRSGTLLFLDSDEGAPSVVVAAEQSARTRTGVVSWMSPQGPALVWLTEDGRIMTYNGSVVSRSPQLTTGFRWAPLVLDVLDAGTLQVVALSDDGTLVVCDRADLEPEQWTTLQVGHRPHGPLLAAQTTADPAVALSFVRREGESVWVQFGNLLSRPLDVDGAVLQPGLMVIGGKPGPQRTVLGAPATVGGEGPAPTVTSDVAPAAFSCQSGGSTVNAASVFALALLLWSRRRRS